MTKNKESFPHPAINFATVHKVFIGVVWVIKLKIVTHVCLCVVFLVLSERPEAQPSSLALQFAMFMYYELFFQSQKQ